MFYQWVDAGAALAQTLARRLLPPQIFRYGARRFRPAPLSEEAMAPQRGGSSGCCEAHPAGRPTTF
jgi:hypothetical protein